MSEILSSLFPVAIGIIELKPKEFQMEGYGDAQLFIKIVETNKKLIYN